jgi:hypothetical protein
VELNCRLRKDKPWPSARRSVRGGE